MAEQPVNPLLVARKTGCCHKIAGMCSRMQDFIIAAVVFVLVIGMAGGLFGAMAGAYNSPKATAAERADAVPVQTYMIVGVAIGLFLGVATVGLKIVYEATCGVRKAAQTAVKSAIELVHKDPNKQTEEQIQERRAKILAEVLGGQRQSMDDQNP